MAGTTAARLLALGLVAGLLGGCGESAEAPADGARSGPAETSATPLDPDPAAETEPATEAPPEGRPDASGNGADVPSQESAATSPEDAGGADGEEPATPESGPGSLPEPPGAGVADLDRVPRVPTLDPARQEVLSEAQGLRAEGERPRAIALLRLAENELGEHALLRLEAAWCFFELAEQAFASGADPFRVKGNLADAHLRHDQAVALEPVLPTAAVLLARIQRYEEDPDSAREGLLAHLEAFPGDALAHYELGDMASVARDWEGADTHHSRAAQLDPRNGRARFHATEAKQWLQAYGLDVLHRGYREAARLLPEEDDPIRLLLNLYTGRPARRLAAIDEVLADNPRAVWARVWKGYLLRDTGDLEGALTVLDEAAALDPRNAAVQINRAQALVAADRSLEAVPVFTRAIEFGDEGTMAAASNELDRLLHLGERSREVPEEERERAYEVMCRKNPREGRFGNNAGLWYRDVARDYEKSLKWYLESVQAQPDDQDYINDTALIYLFHLRDRKAESLPMFLKVLALVEEDGQEPVRGYWDTLENLCKYYSEEGQLERVVEYGDKRANEDARVNGNPYPSAKAAAWRARALRALGRSE